MSALWSDIRYGLRLLVKRGPGSTLVAILTLAIGIGANTAIFSVVNGLLLRPLPYPEPEELVTIWQDHTRRGGPIREWASPDNFFDWRDRSQTFDGMSALAQWGPTLSGLGTPERLDGAVVSHDTLGLLGIEPLLGRNFRPQEDVAGAADVVLLGHSLWSRRFGRSPDVVGETVTLDGAPATVIGVLPSLAAFPILQPPEILKPLAIDRTNSCGRGCLTLRVVGRLGEGVSLERARTDLQSIAARLERDFPADNEGVGASLVPLREHQVAEMRAPLLLLLAAVGLVLLIACANVSSLMMARAVDRQRELATRLAMGASRRRLFRQLLTESLVLATFGSGAGLLLAIWGVDLLRRFVPSGPVPRLENVSIDGPTLLFALLVSLLTGLSFGTLPAARAFRSGLAGRLRAGGRGSSAPLQRLRSALVVAEVAVALALLVGAGLLTKSFVALVRTDPGYDVENVLTLQLSLVGARYDEPLARSSFVSRLLERVEALRQVDQAGITLSLPLTGDNADADFLIEGRDPPKPGREPVAWYRPVSPDYFRTLHMELVEGRSFRLTDTRDASPVVIINEAAAHRYWPNESPLLARVFIGQQWRSVVGVVADARQFGLAEEDRPALYFPYDQLSTRGLTLVARTVDDPAGLLAPMQEAVWELDPELAIGRIATFESILSRAVAPSRVVATLLSLFASTAAFLAAIGIYGMMAESVRQRAREIGIRMALGATTNDLLGWAVGRGMSLLALGLALGLVAALLLTRLMESLLFGVERTDPATFLVAAFLLTLAAAAACYLPARRATRVDPLETLRHE